jgi:5-methylthioadenosine/S-adenosylhomocysteine deaminase
MIRIENAVVYTGEALIRDGAVLTDGDRIRYVGELSGCPGGGRYIDARGGVLMPGFYNTHSHAPMTLLRGVGSDLKLFDWLDVVMPIEERMTDESIYWGGMLAAAEMLARGVVAFADQYYMLENLGRAARDSGMRANLCRGCTSIEGVDSTRALFDAWNGGANGRVKVFVGIHGEYTSSPDVVAYAARVAKELSTGIHLHASETRGETDDCLKRHGVTPIKYFHDLGVFGNHTIAAHCVHATDEDIQILKADGVFVAHNPASNLKLASGIAPIVKMLDAGVNVALGTDGASSNNALDMLADMRLAAIVQKCAANDPTALPPRTAIHMATRMGARAMGFSDAGLLKPGMKADMALIAADRTNMIPMADPLANVAYAAQGLDVRLTMVDGEIVYEDGRFTNFDAAEVLAKARESARFLTENNG